MAQIKKNWTKSNNPVNWEQGCSYCGGKFEETELFVRSDIETSWFRGDDIVQCFHNKCWPLVKVLPCDPDKSEYNRVHKND